MNILLIELSLLLGAIVGCIWPTTIMLIPDVVETIIWWLTLSFKAMKPKRPL